MLSDSRSRLWQLVPDDNLSCKPQVTVAIGSAPDEIVRTARDRQADLIVMGVHQAGAVASHLPGPVKARFRRAAF